MKKATPAHETVTRRTISWSDLYRLRPDLTPKAANDNQVANQSSAVRAAAISIASGAKIPRDLANASNKTRAASTS